MPINPGKLFLSANILFFNPNCYSKANTLAHRSSCNIEPFISSHKLLLWAYSVSIYTYALCCHQLGYNSESINRVGYVGITHNTQQLPMYLVLMPHQDSLYRVNQELSSTMVLQYPDPDQMFADHSNFWLTQGIEPSPDSASYSPATLRKSSFSSRFVYLSLIIRQAFN